MSSANLQPALPSLYPFGIMALRSGHALVPGVRCLCSRTKMENQEKLVYTVGEVAAMLGFSRRAVTCLFEKEPGVIQLTRPETMHKRRYRSLRIPRPVFQRVLARLTK